MPFKKGIIPWSKGLTKENDDRVRKISQGMMGKNNSQWKGDDVGITSLHQWIRDHKPKPKLCVKCKEKPPYDLSNISGEYKRDINDFEWLCRSCHMISDNRMNNRDKDGKFKS